MHSITCRDNFEKSPANCEISVAAYVNDLVTDSLLCPDVNDVNLISAVFFHLLTILALFSHGCRIIHEGH
jgi:hypothetical protein